MVADIHNAIFKALETFAADNALHVAYPNADFVPNENTFIEPFLLFAQTENIGLSVVNQPIVLQVNVNYRDGQGIIGAARIADALIARFPRNSRISAGSHCILFDNQGYPGPVLVNGGWLKMPVTFNLRILI